MLREGSGILSFKREESEDDLAIHTVLITIGIAFISILVTVAISILSDIRKAVTGVQDDFQELQIQLHGLDRRLTVVETKIGAFR